MADILIVEDEAPLSLAAGQMLEKYGHSVMGCIASGEQAIECVKRHSPDIILMDYDLAGDMDGVQTAREIRNHSNAQIVFLTAYSSREIIHRAMETRPCAYLVKPYSEPDLYAAIELALSSKEKLRDRQENGKDDLASWFHTFFDSSRDPAFVLTQDMNISEANPAACGCLGIEMDDLAGESIREFIPYFDVSGGMSMSPGGGKLAEWTAVEFRCRDHTTIRTEMLVQPVWSGNTQYFLAVSQQPKNNQNEYIQYLAYHDSLTGLPNRALLSERIDAALAYSERHATGMAVLYMDLDGFKEINDSLGHHVGDRLLQEVGSRLKGLLRKDVTVCRQGGDEFMMVLSDISGDDDAARVAERIIKALSRPYMIEGHSLNVTASIGVSVYPEDGEDAACLIKKADAAMYEVKRNGRNGYRFFLNKRNDKVCERMSLASDLRKALEREELVMCYQPKIDLASGRFAGMEALVHWQHPVYGRLPAAKFLPLASSTHMIERIDGLVLELVQQDIREWCAKGGVDCPVSINVSGAQFSGAGFFDRMKKLCRGSLSGKLGLELTGQTLMQDEEFAMVLLKKLRSLDFVVTLDNFGAGFSNLDCLKNYPINNLKIDRSYVGHIKTDAHTMALVNLLSEFSSRMGIKVIAGGVECQDEMNLLRQNGCAQAQGYYIAHPMPASDILGWLKAWVMPDSMRSQINDQGALVLA